MANILKLSFQKIFFLVVFYIFVSIRSLDG